MEISGFVCSVFVMMFGLSFLLQPEKWVEYSGREYIGWGLVLLASLHIIFLMIEMIRREWIIKKKEANESK